MSARVDGKIALVTGAGTGIGRATCVSLAREGAEVVVTSRTPAHVEETRSLAEQAGGPTPHAFELDVTDAVQIERVVAAVRERLGRVDILGQ